MADIANIEWDDVSNDCELKEGRALPGGWSQYELWHGGKRIGWIESGNPDITDPDYRSETTPEGENSRLTVYRKPPITLV